MLTAGAVKPGTSRSVEVFTADLVIPESGLRVAFTFKPTMPASQISLELWCWMEPSNSNGSSAESLTNGDSPAADGARSESRDRGGESGGRVLAMLQANGAVMVADEQAPGCTTGQGSRRLAEL